ncbi:MAG: DUF177 domain-containing protein [Eubacterium sp.]|nr:DUF177 domain-containing protein [Eubacterium sp.]
MKINLINLLNGEQDSLSVDYTLDLSNLIYSSYSPVKEPVSIRGRLYSKADVLYLDLEIEFRFCGVCDRCAEEIEKDFAISINKIIVEELQNIDNDDDYIVVDNQLLDLDELVNEEVSLSLPSKILCSDDCKGLCPKCGTNLNVNKCDCKGDVDPRMAALLQLLDNE